MGKVSTKSGQHLVTDFEFHTDDVTSKDTVMAKASSFHQRKQQLRVSIASKTYSLPELVEVRQAPCEDLPGDTPGCYKGKNVEGCCVVWWTHSTV